MYCVSRVIQPDTSPDSVACSVEGMVGGGSPSGGMYPGQSPAMMGGMSTLNQGMANMNVGGPPRMMSPQPMMGQGM